MAVTNCGESKRWREGREHPRSRRRKHALLYPHPGPRPLAIASGPRAGGLQWPRDQLFPNGVAVEASTRLDGDDGVIWGYVLASVLQECVTRDLHLKG